MTHNKRATLIPLCLALAFGANEASAQIAGQENRVFVSVNGGYQGQSQDVALGSTFTMYGEDGSIDAAQTIRGGALFDLGVSYRVWRNVTAGVSFNRTGSKSDADLTASVPHPLFGGEPRSATGTARGLQHSETAVHLQVAYVAPLAGRIDVALFAGPSVFSVGQDLIGDVAISESAAPFNTVSLGNVATTSESKTGIGFNAGADIAYMVTPRIGAGVFFRYATASVDMPATGGNVSLDAGGMQFGAGLRMRF
ncbi:MAG: outer membrane protein [Vicinamibacterales bacterium]